MVALFTLATTTFASNVGELDTQVNLTSTTGVVPGIRLFANRECLAVEKLTGVGNYAIVRRGVDGTFNRPHNTQETVYIARPDQLFSTDPVGIPIAGVYSNPHINVFTGTIWVVQGDDSGPGIYARSWQQVTSTQTAGPLGVRTNTTTTPS
jgi:hypothetical protein